MPRLLIIGATGTIGRQVISQLPTTGPQIRALARNPPPPPWWAPQIRAGADVIRWPHTAAPTAPIHERDIAAVAVRVLTEEGHAGAEYVLTGPESLTQSDQLSIIATATGRPLRMEEISPEDARKELLPIMPAPAINMLLNAWAAAIGQPAFVTSTVADLTGAPPRTFRAWATDHAADFRP